MPEATAIIRDLLRTYGLESLTDWAMNAIAQGLTEAEIVQSMRARPEFEARFPAIAERERRGLSPISPGEYVEYETRAAQTGRFYNLPFNLDRDQIKELLAGDVSMVELESRIQDGFNRVATAPPQVREWFGQVYGASGDVALAAAFIDPDLAMPELAKRAAAAEVGGFGAMYGIGGIGRETAESVASLGVGRNEIQGGLDALSRQAGLYEETVTESPDLAIGTEGIESQFGLDPGAREAVRRRTDQRMAAFAGSNEAVGSQQGLTGLGAAER